MADVVGPGAAVLLTAGPLAAVAVVLWAVWGTAFVGQWQQQQLRRDLAAQLAADGQPATTPANPQAGTVSATAPAPPAFGFRAASRIADQPAGGTLDLVTGRLPVSGPALALLPSEDFTADDGAEPSGSVEEIIGRMRAPAVDLDWVLGAGVGVPDLRAGPGWMPGTARPGQAGNTVISGHRTTYGAPFGDLDRLEVNDRIMVDLPGGDTIVYEVRDLFVVDPDEVAVAATTDGARLTLTTCTPVGSDRHRLVVQAELLVGPAAGDAVHGDDWEPFDGPSRTDDIDLQR